MGFNLAFKGLRVFENRVLRRVSAPKGYEVTGDRRKMHNEDLYGLYDLYSSSNIFWMIKSR